MRIKFLLTPVLLGQAVLAFAQPVPQTRNLRRTFGEYNGRGWLDLSEGSRLAYVEGIESAVTAAYERAVHTPCEHQTGLLLEAYRMPGFTGAEEMAAINRFYDEPANLLIRIRDAVEIVAAKARGVPQQEIDKRIAVHRRVANEAPERK